MRKILLAATFLTAVPAHAGTIPFGDYLQWYSGASYFDYSNQTFEYATDVVLPTNATGAFTPFVGRLDVVPNFGDPISVDIPIGQIGMGGAPWMSLALGGFTMTGTLTQFPLVVIEDKPDLFGIASGWGSCTLTLTGFDATMGQCGIWTAPVDNALAPAGWWTGYGVVSSGQPIPVPAPTVGSIKPLIELFLRKFIQG